MEPCVVNLAKLEVKPQTGLLEWNSMGSNLKPSLDAFYTILTRLVCEIKDPKGFRKHSNKSIINIENLKLDGTRNKNEWMILQQIYPDMLLPVTFHTITPPPPQFCNPRRVISQFFSGYAAKKWFSPCKGTAPEIGVYVLLPLKGLPAVISLRTVRRVLGPRGGGEGGQSFPSSTYAHVCVHKRSRGEACRQPTRAEDWSGGLQCDRVVSMSGLPTQRFIAQGTSPLQIATAPVPELIRQLFNQET